MPPLPEVIVTMLLPFERLFDRRTWRKAQLLVVGCQRRRKSDPGSPIWD